MFTLVTTRQATILMCLRHWVSKECWCFEHMLSCEVFKRECLTALDYLHGVEDGPCEYQVTVLLTCDTVTEANDKGFDVYTFVQALPFVEATVAVEARQAERSNPTVKDVQWVNDRQHLEEIQSQAGVNEVIMHDERGKITEGLQTNFFAERNGTLYTAPDDRVLSGTVRKVVLEVAQEHGIPVELECPNISEMNQWDSCFICSTSRLAAGLKLQVFPESRVVDSCQSFRSIQYMSHKKRLSSLR